MKMKRAVPFAMSALLISGAAIPTAAFAEEGTPTENVQTQPDFVKFTGTIEKVETRENSTHYYVKEGEQEGYLVVTKDTLVFDNTGKKAELKKGDKVTGYTDGDKPMIMIYPPQYSPDVVILETEEPGSVAIGKFNEDLLNDSLSLKLHVSDKTELSSVSGKKVTADDLHGKDLVVFYTITTRSIPAQTTPEKIVVLDEVASDDAETPDQGTVTNPAIDKIIEADHYEVDGVKMVPLRLIAEELGYKVSSTGKGAIVSKGALSFTITRGEKSYGYNKSLRYFEVAPALLAPSKTYVPATLIDELMEAGS
ncbi:stalk domain-containing protein [Sporosarcina sp. Te-1]|uniref:stalk domain-containing protein n=1 Tax=Sporosarcina sp. Te-1 TaxID=2818390 RepID=UPI001A9E9AD5|nr:stalk domain-containing protein [Sporosarcina sp. Te-1]QTD43124.1 copper amine oxidase N-terminal domain-containing protein [Sporosarcina sp. Te-1]